MNKNICIKSQESVNYSQKTGKLQEKNQRELFRTRLEDMINPNHELALLSKAIDWNYFDEEFKNLYSENGRPGMPVRLMIGCLILRHMYNLGDERLPEFWICDVYTKLLSKCNLYKLIINKILLHFRLF
jgi:IS5 family transposase